MLDVRFQQLQSEHPFQNLNEGVYETLYRCIIDLSLLPGSALSETALAEQMGISRTPVRNALSRLQAIGLVTQEKGQAFCVSDIQKKECRELMEARLAIEGQAAYRAAERADEKDLSEIDTCMAAFLKSYKSWAIDGMVESDHRFHQAIVEAAHNAVLAELYSRLSPRVLHYRHYLFHQAEEQALRPIMGASVRNHQSVCNAIKLGFPAVARECMEKDISGMPDIISSW